MPDTRHIDPNDYMPMLDPEPDFAVCGNCGADANDKCRWDPALGWCCSNCGAADGDE